jgi:hypothetical protein
VTGILDVIKREPREVFLQPDRLNHVFGKRSLTTFTQLQMGTKRRRITSILTT